jgi:hypothetical protein
MIVRILGEGQSDLAGEQPCRYGLQLDGEHPLAAAIAARSPQSADMRQNGVAVASQIVPVGGLLLARGQCQRVGSRLGPREDGWPVQVGRNGLAQRH